MTSYYNITTWSFYSLFFELSMYFYDKLSPSRKFLISCDLWKSLSVHLLLHFVSLIPGTSMIILWLSWRKSFPSWRCWWRQCVGNDFTVFFFHLFVSRTLSRIIFNTNFYPFSKCGRNNKSRWSSDSQHVHSGEGSRKVWPSVNSLRRGRIYFVPVKHYWTGKD